MVIIELSKSHEAQFAALQVPQFIKHFLNYSHSCIISINKVNTFSFLSINIKRQHYALILWCTDPAIVITAYNLVDTLAFCLIYQLNLIIL